MFVTLPAKKLLNDIWVMKTAPAEIGEHVLSASASKNEGTRRAKVSHYQMMVCFELDVSNFLGAYI